MVKLGAEADAFRVDIFAHQESSGSHKEYGK